MVKAATRNLMDRSAGVQMDPPDHLRSHFQTFQALAYNLKLKHPNLKRNVKFCDAEMDPEMDFTLGDGKWRTIGVQVARDVLKEAKARNSKNTKKDLCNVGGYFRTEFAFIFIKVGHGSRSTNRQTRMRIFAKLSLLRR